MIDQAKKTFRVVKDGKYLGFNFDARTGKMDPYFDVKAMSYSFTEGEAWDLLDVLAERHQIYADDVVELP